MSALPIISCLFVGINRVCQGNWQPGESSFKLEFHGKDDSYGNPPEGSLTEARHRKACRHINKEISQLLCIIRGIGTRDPDSGKVCVTFYKLFRYYIPISDKIVGLLLRARRWKLVEFPGEMLYQGQDDNVVITLMVNEEDIPHNRRFEFGSTPDSKHAAREGSYPTSEVSVSTMEMNNNSSQGSMSCANDFDEYSTETMTNDLGENPEAHAMDGEVQFFLNQDQSDFVDQ